MALEREELRDVIDLALWTGQLLLQQGAETQRVEETIHRLGTALGCDWMDILISPNAIIATTTSGEEFRTKIRRVVRYGVDMSTLAAIHQLSRRVENGEMDRFEVRAELRRISDAAPHYNRWVVVVMVGLACGAFSRLFDGDWVIFFMTSVASSVAMYVRQELHRRYFNPLLVIVATAFVAGLIAGVVSLFHLSSTPETALAASVLLLVPGVPLINSAEDIIQGHIVIGLTRGVNGLVISLCIALGLVLAMRILGVSGL
ncbi:MAG: threonine/serine exporter family protein [Anaerolineae bacterium]|nr:threonine/serine exporter family protein [Anaerolineae bacterium]